MVLGSCFIFYLRSGSSCIIDDTKLSINHRISIWLVGMRAREQSWIQTRPKPVLSKFKDHVCSSLRKIQYYRALKKTSAPVSNLKSDQSFLLLFKPVKRERRERKLISLILTMTTMESPSKSHPPEEDVVTMAENLWCARVQRAKGKDDSAWVLTWFAG